MASSTRKSLAGSAAAVAKKVIGRRAASGAATQAPAEKASAKKAPAKKTSAAGKTPATKAPAAKKTPATKAPAAKKTVATKAPAAKKTAATKAPAAKKTAATKAPAAKKTPATKAPAAKKTVAKKTTAKKTPAKQKAPAKAAPANQKPVKEPQAVKKAPVKKIAAATATAKKASVSSLVVKEGEGAWTKAELNEVLQELHGQHDKLAHVIEDAEVGLAGLMKDAGDGAGHDQADMGATSFERDHELTVVNLERDMVAQIDKALGRIDDGTYGVCEACGEPIGKMRLMAFPRATLCLPCKQREERR